MYNLLLLLSLLILSSCSTIMPGKKASKENIEIAKQRTMAEATEDLRISAGLHMDLAALELYKPIDVKVINGKVILTGSVETEKNSFIAVGAAWKQNGVKEVVNELKIDRPSFSVKQFTQDSWITTNLKARMLVTPEINSSNYTVITTNGIVYLFGKADSKAEINRVKQLAKKVNGVKKVVSKVNFK